MPNKPLTPKSLADQLSDIESEAKANKVELTPSVRQYTETHLHAVQEKLVNGEGITEEDLEFISEVRIWVGMAENMRVQYTSIESMLAEKPEAEKRKISLKQWLDLLHVTEAKEEHRIWIEETFRFHNSDKPLANYGILVEDLGRTVVDSDTLGTTIENLAPKIAEFDENLQDLSEYLVIMLWPCMKWYS